MAKAPANGSKTNGDSDKTVHQRVYLERTQFFFKRIRETGISAAMASLRARVGSKDVLALSWSLIELGISKSAWKRVLDSGHAPVLYFCHPDVIRADPRLIAFYRGAGLLSQKGAAYAGLHTERFERGAVSPNPEQASAVANLVNRHISQLLERTNLSPDEVEHLAFVSLGAQIQGSWNNAVGAGATQNVKRLLIGHWHTAGVIQQLLKRRVKNPVDPGALESILDSVSDYYGVVFTNGGKAVFASEPDVALRNPKGTLSAAIEIKGGTDPAGALERLGAAEKSFRAARAESPKNPCKTILLLAVITEEVSRRIAAEPALFNSTYELAELYVNDEKLEAFQNEVDEQLWLLGK